MAPRHESAEIFFGTNTDMRPAHVAQLIFHWDWYHLKNEVWPPFIDVHVCNGSVHQLSYCWKFWCRQKTPNRLVLWRVSFPLNCKEIVIISLTVHCAVVLMPVFLFALLHVTKYTKTLLNVSNTLQYEQRWQPVNVRSVYTCTFSNFGWHTSTNSVKCMLVKHCRSASLPWHWVETIDK